ncbi:MAG: hypothetical protein QG670_942 [Thermoproteota archaeon]|nr:hypothetical protein [Thermoproteota archaeon]
MESQFNIRNKQRRKIEVAVQEVFKKLRMQRVNSDMEKTHAEAEDILYNLLVTLGFEDFE